MNRRKPERSQINEDCAALTFEPLIVSTGPVLDLGSDAFPTLVHGFKDGKLSLDAFGGSTHYGMVTHGTSTLQDAIGEHKLRAGMFFVCPGGCSIEAEGGAGIVITRLNYRGLWQLGGPVEEHGRLQYIDGCTDTLLASPPRMGEPCLNHLHIPPNTNQTPHTHPSVRIGVILRGAGECRTSDKVYPLTAGMAWYIPTGCLHSFYTQDSSLDVIAWHPDSDFGPTDENHPMVNRTIIGH